MTSAAAATSFTCARKADGTLWCWGSNESGRLGDGTITNHATPEQVVALGGSVLDFDSRGELTCARKTDGSLWCWGLNNRGGVGDGTTTSPRISPTANLVTCP